MKYIPPILAILIALFIYSSCKESDGKTAAFQKDSLLLHKPDFAFRKLSAKEVAYWNELVDSYYTKNLAPGFNGSILVAKNGDVVFEKYLGYINFETKESITENTPFHLASISKTFTGMAILKMVEEGRLGLDDPITKFFPQLSYKGVTVHMLLDHRSGLPNYLDFMDSAWDKKRKATNEDVLQFMIDHKPPIQAPPNRVFHYCNTNFMLLALILEKITAQPYPVFMRDSVFLPLGMKHTYVFSIKDTLSYVPTYLGNKSFPMDYLDCTYGDKNIYSTVNDLLLWDKSLYQHTFINKPLLDMAFTPQSHEVKTMHNYGLGWRLFNNQNENLIYHNGKWHGSNTVFTRVYEDTATIIILGNKFNRNIYKGKDIANLFTGKKDELNLAE
ncbi:MAG: beta-lactamase family protein [Bacteroidetes bacterium]|nr:beta-lactamase family protein [Bacteroidota bacterium]